MRMIWRLIFTVITAAVVMVACNEADTQAGNRLKPVDHSYGRYAQILDQHVEGSRVDYAALNRDRARLDSTVEMISNADLSAASEDQKLSFYINAYNVLTLRSIIDAYPVESIKDIDDVWEKEWRVAGNEISIDEIEHKVLRQDFDEPRIHMAINCASISCPPLMPWPYVADSLNQQLHYASVNFATTDQYNELHPKEGRAELSQVFEWFGGDFVEQYYDPHRFAGLPVEGNAALMFVIEHHPEVEQQVLLQESYEIEFRDYDWGLNDVNN